MYPRKKLDMGSVSDPSKNSTWLGIRWNQEVSNKLTSTNFLFGFRFGLGTVMILLTTGGTTRLRALSSSRLRHALTSRLSGPYFEILANIHQKLIIPPGLAISHPHWTNRVGYPCPSGTNGGIASSLKSPDSLSRSSDVPTLVPWLRNHLGLLITTRVISAHPY